jgi:hypothetical protein
MLNQLAVAQDFLENLPLFVAFKVLLQLPITSLLPTHKKCMIFGVGLQ